VSDIKGWCTMRKGVARYFSISGGNSHAIILNCSRREEPVSIESGGTVIK
jgi:hypothetical protein